MSLSQPARLSFLFFNYTWSLSVVKTLVDRPLRLQPLGRRRSWPLGPDHHVRPQTSPNTGALLAAGIISSLVTHLPRDPTEVLWPP